MLYYEVAITFVKHEFALVVSIQDTENTNLISEHFFLNNLEILIRRCNKFMK